MNYMPKYYLWMDYNTYSILGPEVIFVSGLTETEKTDAKRAPVTETLIILILFQSKGRKYSVGKAQKTI